jgi:hypothetical protein
MVHIFPIKVAAKNVNLNTHKPAVRAMLAIFQALK